MFENLKNKLGKAKYKLFADKRVALIKLEGIIIDTGAFPVASKIIESIESIKDMGIKTLVLRINSPGGTVGASQEIHNAIKRLQNDGVKVVASFGDVAASGGVYVGVAADKIVSNSGTVTGSIGVILKTNILKDLYKKLGIDHEVVKSGAYKDILSSLKYLSDDEKKILQELINSTYEQFVKVVAEGRNLEVEKVKSFADGRIFSGIQAKEYGLVDEIGSQSDAVDIAAKLAGIQGKPKVIELSPKKSFLQKVTGASLSEMLDNIGVSTLYSGIPLWIMPGF